MKLNSVRDEISKMKVCQNINFICGVMLKNEKLKFIERNLKGIVFFE